MAVGARPSDHVKKAELTENRIALKFSVHYGYHNELIRWLIYTAFIWQLCFCGDLDYK